MQALSSEVQVSQLIRLLGNGKKEIKTLYIEPGSAWQNGYIESFHSRVRDECLNRE